RAVLDHVHHLVCLTNDVMRRFRVVRIRSESHRSPHIEIQSFFFAETASAQAIPQSMRDNQRLVFSGLWEQNYKLVPAVAERKIDQSKLRFDQISDLCQQFAADKVPMGIVHALEVIEIDEQNRKFISKPS